MAITGKFLADFTSFHTAVQQAEVQLRSFETGAHKVETQLSRMTDGFTGRKVITEATLMVRAIDEIGGASKLTAQEQAKVNRVVEEAIAKYTILGQTAPKALRDLATATQQTAEKTSVLGGAFQQLVAGFTVANLLDRAVRSVVSFGVETFKSAGAIIDLSNKLGVSTDAIQKWTAAGVTSGVTTEDFANAAFKLGVNVEAGGGKARKAAEDLGLSFAALRAMSPEQQFDAVAAALERMEDPARRNRDAVDLMGKSAAAVLPAIADGYTKIAAEANVTANAQLQALDRMGDAWDRYYTQQQTKLRSWLGANVVFFETLSKLTKDQQAEFDRLKGSGFFGEGPARARKFVMGLAETEGAVTPETTKAAAAPPIPPNFVADLDAAQKAMANLTAEQRKQIAAGVALKASTDDIVNSTGVAANVIELYKDRLTKSAAAATKAAEEQKKFAAALADVLSAGENWQATLDTINGATVESVRAGLAAGTTAEKLAIVYGLTATQIAAVVTQTKLLTTVQQENLTGPGRAMATLQAELQAKLGKTFDAGSKAFTDNQAVIVASANSTANMLAALGENELEANKRRILENAAAKKRGLDTEASNYHDAMAAIDRETETAMTIAQASWDAHIDAMTAHADEIPVAFRNALEQIPDLIAAAFIGGGSAVDAVRALASRLGALFADTFKQVAQISLAATGSMFNKFTAASAGITGAAAAMGSALSGASAKAGVASAAMQGLSVASTVIGTSIAVTGTATAAAVGSAIALGAATAGIGAAAVLAVVGLKKLFGDSEKAINKNREAFVQAHGGLYALAQAANEAGISIDRLLAAKNAKQFKAAVDEINAALEKTKAAADAARAAIKFQEDAMAKLQKIAEKYGFTVDELGPAWAEQELDKKALELYEDWQLLLAGGVDIVNIIKRMGPSINEYVNASRKAGIAIPESMRAIIEKMIEMGLLTDENGNKITSLEAAGIHFKETMEEQFAKLILSIQALADAIRLSLHLPIDEAASKARDLGQAIRDIPTKVTIEIEYIYPPGSQPPGSGPGGTVNNPPPPAAFMGGAVTHTGIVAPQYLGAGGQVGGSWGPARGTDTVRAWLTPGEMVLTAKQQRSLFEARAQPAPMTVNVFVEKDGTASVMTDTAAFNRRVQDAMRSGAVVVPSSAVVSQV